MQYVGLIMPVLPGKTDEAKRFGQEIMHNRLQDHDRNASGVDQGQGLYLAPEHGELVCV